MKLSAYLIIGLSWCPWLLSAGPGGNGENMAQEQPLPDFDKLWDYNDLQATLVQFEKLLPTARDSGNMSYYLQLLTQIARTYSLQGEFDEAHRHLDTVEQALTDELKLVRVRYLLERGRTYRSAGDPKKSLPLFESAYAIAAEIGEDYYAIDAAHMVAIAAEAPEEKQKWNLIGIELADKSKDERARRWRGSLCNNMGWDYHDKGEYEKALEMFELALKAREEQGEKREIDIARWCIARTYRSLNRIDNALGIQLELLARHEKTGEGGGYMFEELGELYLLKGEQEKARQYFAQAYELLSKDTWFAQNEKDRLERIKKLRGVDQ